jgi:AcrR family transcriptional regulator
MMEPMPYDNSLRASRAAETRRRVLAEATSLFLDRGYAATTVRAVAEAAAVSPESIYKGFGSKAALLKAAYDVLLAGDDQQVAMAARPAIAAVREAATPAAAAAAYAGLARVISSQVGPLLQVVLGARGTDADLDAFVATIDEERLRGTGAVVAAWQERGWLRTDLALPEARDRLWLAISPPSYLMLRDRGWSDDDYERWVAETVGCAVLR